MSLCYLALMLLYLLCYFSSYIVVDAVDDVGLLLEFIKGIDKDPLGSVKSSWVHSNIDSHGCPSNWHGVSCSSGRVTSLDLEGLALSGQINIGTLGHLSALTFLSLRNNFLTGPIPDDLSKLSLLQTLDFSNNIFKGPIPRSFVAGAFKNLQNLSLANNQLSGTIPDMFDGMPSLLQLDLSKNLLFGDIPASIVSLEKLVYLDLSLNQLNGSVPTHMDLLQDLEVLDIHRNNLTGSIGASWMSLEKIQRVDLSRNKLSGMLPWLDSLLPPNLLYVNLSFNHLSGLLAPENAANLFANKIQILDTSNNQLSGALPSFEFVFSLRILKLNRNMFTGFVPPALLSSEASLLEELDLSENQLSGNVWSISAARLNFLNLSTNMLSGGLPPRLGSCALVDLSNNLFSGNLSVMKTWGNSLETINLSNNSIDGDLPNETAQLLRMISLDLSHNNLLGNIPHSFGAFPKITSLDISSNQLTGIIPTSFFFSVSLSTLRLSNNHLAGSIPLNDPVASSSVRPESAAQADSVPFSPLRVLDLSGNQLNGSIPSQISSFSTLEVLNLRSNNLSGPIPSQLAELDNLRNLDLSFNKLTGAIPGKLPPVLTELQLSHNELSGSIPPSLEKKYPPSSFYPGNTNLQSTGFPSWNGSPEANEPKGIVSAQHKKVSPGFRAGLIGGCTAGAVLLIVVGLLIYYRVVKSQDHARMPVFRVVDKELPGPKVISSPQRVDDTKGFAMRFSREPAAPVASFTTTAKGKEAESVKMSPSRRIAKTFFASSPQAEAAKSPDRLAGDLFLLDNSVGLTAEELSRAPAEVLGRSSHGTSYKATLDNGHTITVKWLKEGLAKSKKEFTAEAKKFEVVQHPNVLPLRGYYWGPREHEKLILTDYLAFGSLADRLSERSEKRHPPLTWPQRLRISAGIASGLSYLHNEHRMPHGNLKTSNVLLDGSELEPRLSDYSLHKLMTAAGTAAQILNAGAMGYRAPELSNVKRPKPSLKADVYAYGVVLLEILTGKRAGDIITGNSGAVDLTDWVRFLISENRTIECFDQTIVADQGLQKKINELLGISLSCTSEASTRPAIKAVYEQVVALNVDETL